MSTVLSTFDRWKQFLSERVNQAQQSGMQQDTISKLAVEIGDFLANRVDPKNDEQRVLREIWSVADENERQTIARVMVKLVGDGRQS